MVFVSINNISRIHEAHLSQNHLYVYLCTFWVQMFVLFYRNKIKKEIIVEDFTYIIYTMLKIILVCSFEEDFLKFSKSATNIHIVTMFFFTASRLNQECL
jgi:hypothetical protein